MRLRRRLALACLAPLVACATVPEPSVPTEEPPPTAPASGQARKPVAAVAPAPAVDCEQGDGEPEPENVEIIQPDERVPAFHVATTSCELVSSETAIGDKPLVLVFFSSWCGVCEKKMPVIRETMDELGDDARFIGVALDDRDTWSRVAPFMARHELSMPLIRGDLFQRFSLGFNPFRSIPVVLVVGRDGHLIDLQLGFSPFDKNRLLGAVEIAKRREPATSRRTPEAAPAESRQAPRTPASRVTQVRQEP